jgi:transcriptional regulator with XRE-family HTH domain
VAARGHAGRGGATSPGGDPATDPTGGDGGHERPATTEADTPGGSAVDAGDADEDRSTAERLRELGSYIKEQRSRAQYSLRHLARIAGVSNPYLSQIERGLRKPSAEILQAIAKALQISSETLYVKAGLLEEPAETPDLEVAIMHDESLTDRQRAALVEIYRSFRQENEPTGRADAPTGPGAASGGAVDGEGAGEPPAGKAGTAAG